MALKTVTMLPAVKSMVKSIVRPKARSTFRPTDAPREGLFCCSGVWESFLLFLLMEVFRSSLPQFYADAQIIACKTDF